MTRPARIPRGPEQTGPVGNPNAEDSGNPDTTMSPDLARKDQAIRTGRGGVGNAGGPAMPAPRNDESVAAADIPPDLSALPNPQSQATPHPAPDSGATGSASRTGGGNSGGTIEPSEEAKNQRKVGEQSRAVSGTTAPSRA